MAQTLISIVIPIYKEEKNLLKLIERLDLVTNTMPDIDWQYVLVNDGSTDNSWGLIKKLTNESFKVTGIDLSRNFGKEIALTAGVHYARDSHAVICIDADLQHPPELISELIEKWRNGAEIVGTVRMDSDKEFFLRKLASGLYYWIMARVTDLSMMPHTTDFGLYDYKVVDTFCEVTEHGRIFRGIMDWMGFRSVYIEFVASARSDGVATYSYKKLWQLAINSITNFSLWPLKIVGYLGISITMASGLLMFWMLVNYLLRDELLYTPLAIVVVANTLLIGIVLSAIGLIALYVGAIHTEVINRPLYVIRETVGSVIARP